MNRTRKIFSFFLIMILIVSSFSMTIYADASTPSTNPTVEDVNAIGLLSSESSDEFFETQPVDAEVTVPDGASFSVELEDGILESECEFQWYFIDKEEQVFKLDGTSAKTSTLYIPSSEQGIGNCKVCCKVSYDGEDHWSRLAAFTVNDNSELDALLYVGNYVLFPGESIDLSHPSLERLTDPALGSGTISFSDDGSTVTFDNIDMTNDSMVYDTTTSPALNIMYRAWNNEREKLHLVLKGDNKMYNGFYQESTNGSGIPVDFYCMGESLRPELVIEGAGTLAVTGGTYLVRHNGDVTIKSDLVLRGIKDHFCDGIHSEVSAKKTPSVETEDVYKYRTESDLQTLLKETWQTVDDSSELFLEDYAKISGDTVVTVCEGVNIDADINGTGIFSQKAINICQGSRLKIKSGIPAVGAGDSAKNVIYSSGVTINGAAIDINMYYDPERFSTVPENVKVAAAFAGISSARDNMIIDNSDISIIITAGVSESPLVYAYNGVGLNTAKNKDLSINKSKLSITMDSSEVKTGKGISCGGNLFVTDSTIESSMKSLSEAYSIYVNKDINIKDSSVIAEADAYPFDRRGETIEKSRGLLSNGGHIRISERTPEFYVSASSADGIAFGSDFKDDEQTPAVYDPSYKAEYINLSDGCKIVTPEGGVISTASRENHKRTYYVSETVYDPADTTKEASKVIIRKVEPPVKTGDNNNIILYSFTSILALIGACSVYAYRRKIYR